VKILKNVRRGKFAREPEENREPVSKIAKDFISCCLTKNPAKRYDYYNLLEQEWMNGYQVRKGLQIYTVARKKFEQRMKPDIYGRNPM